MIEALDINPTRATVNAENVVICPDEKFGYRVEVDGQVLKNVVRVVAEFNIDSTPRVMVELRGGIGQ